MSKCKAVLDGKKVTKVVVTKPGNPPKSATKQ